MRFVLVIIKTCLNTNDGLDCIHRNQPYDLSTDHVHNICCTCEFSLGKHLSWHRIKFYIININFPCNSYWIRYAKIWPLFLEKWFCKSVDRVSSVHSEYHITRKKTNIFVLIWRPAGCSHNQNISRSYVGIMWCPNFLKFCIGNIS